MRNLIFLLLFCVITSCATQDLAINYKNPSLECENCDEID